MTNTLRPAGRPRFPRASALLTILCLAVAARPDAAAPTELFFSEYIEGSSNNKALEIFNGTGAAIDLAAGAYSVQMFFNGSAASGLTINLTGTVADGDVYVLAHSSAGAVVLAQADQTNGAGWFNGDDAVVLRRNGVIVDAIGQAGFDPGTEWGTSLTSTADNSLRRRQAFCGDPISTDPFDPIVEWDGLAQDTFDGLGAHTADCDVEDEGPSVASTVPANGAVGVGWDANLSVTFSEPVNVTGAWFTLACVATGAHTAAITGGPTTFTINPDSDLAPGESCTLTVVAANVSDQDASDPPDQMVANLVATFATQDADVCSSSYTPAYAIQGSGATSALTGPGITTQGVVVGDFEVPATGTGQLRGFYLQDVAGDGNTATSDAIFVFNPGNNVSVGDFVRVTGTVGEFQEQTQLSSVTSLVNCGAATVPPVDVTLPFPSADFPERYEGMLVRLPQTLTVTEHFQLGRFGQVVVSSGGRLVQPTDVQLPGPAADALQAANNLNRLIVDDATNLQNPDPIDFGRNGQPLSAANTLRGGDTATATVGVMTYTWAGNSASGNAYRVRPLGSLNGFVRFDPASPRPSAAPPRSGTLRVASMNLLNFFNTFSGCTNGAGGAATDCRGAEDQAEFDRQWPKTVAAIIGSQADIVGIIEIENDGYGPSSAIRFLVDRLNAASAPGTYAFIDVDALTGQVNALGTDAIKVGILYKPGRAIPIGQTAALNTVAFVNSGDGFPRNRPSLAQAFEEVGTGGRFVLDVNHFKSKGSECDAPDANDGQGACNIVRTTAADELMAWLANDPTGTGDPDVLIVGDLNSYSMEDPIRHFEAMGYENLRAPFGGGHSYVFDGQWGSLDHGLATASLRPQVTGVDDWYINADEPGVIDYNTNFKSAGQIASLYAPDWFRVADHNPLLVDLMLTAALDPTARVFGGGQLVLTASGGAMPGDPGSTLDFAVSAKYVAGFANPFGAASLIFRSTGSEGLRVYQVRTTALTALLRDASTGQATLLGNGSIHDITDPSAPVPVDAHVTVRAAVDDNGKPGALRDTIALTVWTPDGTLWFTSAWPAGQAAQTIASGDIHVQ